MGVSEEELWRAALSGAQAAQMDGGMARIKLMRSSQPQYHKDVPGAISKWILAREAEDLMPTSPLHIAYDKDNANGCKPMSAEVFSGKAALLKDSGGCSMSVRAKHAQDAGASIVILVTQGAGSVPKQAKADKDDALSIPLLTVVNGDP